MAPAIAGTKAARGEPSPEAQAKMRSMMMETMGKVRAHVETTFDYVGDTFAREARAIHEGRSEERGIYGEAKPQRGEGPGGGRREGSPPAPRRNAQAERAAELSCDAASHPSLRSGRR